MSRCLLSWLLALFALTASPAAVRSSDGPQLPASHLPVPAAADTAVTSELALAFTDLIRDAIPDKYAREKDWGRTKRITTGLRAEGSGLRWRLTRRKKHVPHGVWKRYRVSLIEPEQNLRLRIENLRNVGPGRAAMSLLLSTKLHGWAQAKIYNRGIHVVAITGEADTRVDLKLDCEVAIRMESNELLPDIVVEPVVHDARVKLHGFRLQRLGELRGPVAKELSSGLRRIIEDELEPRKLTRKLNRAIDKKRDRLRLSSEDLIDSAWGQLHELTATGTDPSAVASLGTLGR